MQTYDRCAVIYVVHSTGDIQLNCKIVAKWGWFETAIYTSNRRFTNRLALHRRPIHHRVLFNSAEALAGPSGRPMTGASAFSSFVSIPIACSGQEGGLHYVYADLDYKIGMQQLCWIEWLCRHPCGLQDARLYIAEL